MYSNSHGQTLVPVRLLSKTNEVEQAPNALECSLHTLPKPLHREFHHVFNEKYLDAKFQQGAGIELLAIPTNQRARMDLVAVGDDVEAEKDRLLNTVRKTLTSITRSRLSFKCIPACFYTMQFMDFAADFCQKIKENGFWADYIDPCSGLPMLTPDCNTKVYSEVDGMEVLLGYRAHNAGFCKILTHPKWGSAVYPATIFCYAPRELTAKILESYPLVS